MVHTKTKGLKFFAVILCLHLHILMVLPTVKAIKMTYAKQCHSACCSKGSNEEPNGCQKEKCVLNFNFNNATFLVFNMDYQLSRAIDAFETKEKVNYHNNLIAQYNGTIWQPPEFVSIV